MFKTGKNSVIAISTLVVYDGIRGLGKFLGGVYIHTHVSVSL